MIEEIRINSVDHLIRALNELSNSYIYRGHADARWTLQSTLERISDTRFDDEFVETWEKFSRSIFGAKFHIYDMQNDRPESKLEWLALMQHYGVPTRLLDFTTSPYVALYFAIETFDPRNSQEFAVYAIDNTAMMQASVAVIRKSDTQFTDTIEKISIESRQDSVFTDTVDRFSYPILWATEPSKLNVRIDRQAGCFVLTGKKSLSIEAALTEDAYKACDARKFIVPGSLFAGVYALLRKMNISATTIYGDLQGLAASLRAELRVRTAKATPPNSSRSA